MLYHTNTHGPSEAGFRAGIMKAISEAMANGTNSVLLTTHTLENLKGVMTSVLGEDAVKAFAKAKIATVENVTIHLETERIRSSFSNGVVFAPFVSPTLLAKALADPRATDSVYVPWAEAELQAYMEAHPTSNVV